MPQKLIIADRVNTIHAQCGELVGQTRCRINIGPLWNPLEENDCILGDFGVGEVEKEEQQQQDEDAPLTVLNLSLQLQSISVLRNILVRERKQFALHDSGISLATYFNLAKNSWESKADHK